MLLNYVDSKARPKVVKNKLILHLVLLDMSRLGYFALTVSMFHDLLLFWHMRPTKVLIIMRIR